MILSFNNEYVKFLNRDIFKYDYCNFRYDFKIKPIP